MNAKVWTQFGPLIALAALFGLNVALQPGIALQPEYIRNLLNQNAAVGIIAIGMTLVIITGGIDLSVGSMIALAAGLGLMFTNHLIGQGQPEMAAVSLGVLASIGVGLAGGLLNGTLIAKLRFAPFIATLAGLVGFRSTIVALAEGGEIRSGSPTIYRAFGNEGMNLMLPGKTLTITWPIFAFLAVALAYGYLLNRTAFGRRAVAVGSNERAALYSGIDTDRIKLGAYALLGLCVGIAGWAAGSRTNSVSSAQMGNFYELDAIAAVVIGGTRMSGGAGRIWGTVVGVILLGLIANMLTTSNISTYWQGLVKGVIILLAVLIQRGQRETNR
jgi:ribose transport system permease protein